MIQHGHVEETLRGFFRVRKPEIPFTSPGHTNKDRFPEKATHDLTPHTVAYTVSV